MLLRLHSEMSEGGSPKKSGDPFSVVPDELKGL
jgi:hypothetical protein